MLISHTYKFIFLHIPKTAGSSVAATLKRNLNKNDLLLCPHTKAVRLKLTAKDKWKDYFKFTFVRNPWDRMVSAYFFLRNFRNRKIGKKSI
ncbi:MAG: sulfotransferase family 2 domain-containing protein [Candidatus Omnitrophota bacterium]